MALTNSEKLTLIYLVKKMSSDPILTTEETFQKADALLFLLSKQLGESEGGGDIDDEELQSIMNHLLDYDNPHNITKQQIDLGNVDNTTDIDKPLSTASIAEFSTKVDKELGKGLSQEEFQQVPF